MSKKLLAVLMLVLFVMVSPVAFADEDGEGVGSVACKINSSAPIRPGHFAIIAKYADEYLSGVAGRTIFASVFNDGINDFANPYDDLSDFYLLDIRSAADFAKGHIQGAVNVPFALVAKPENLMLYPTDKPILVICYTGHTASVATGILNTLGYDTWTLRFGMMSWTASSSQKIYSPSKSQTIYGGGYPVE
jgi:rhodanese-related sulfurtransferase